MIGPADAAVIRTSLLVALILTLTITSYGYFTGKTTDAYLKAMNAEVMTNNLNSCAVNYLVIRDYASLPPCALQNS